MGRYCCAVETAPHLGRQQRPATIKVKLISRPVFLFNLVETYADKIPKMYEFLSKGD